MHLLLEIKGRLGCGELNIDLMMLNTSRLCATDVDKRNVLFFTDGKKAKRPFYHYHTAMRAYGIYVLHALRLPPRKRDGSADRSPVRPVSRRGDGACERGGRGRRPLSRIDARRSRLSRFRLPTPHCPVRRQPQNLNARKGSAGRGEELKGDSDRSRENKSATANQRDHGCSSVQRAFFFLGNWNELASTSPEQEKKKNKEQVE